MNSSFFPNRYINPLTVFGINRLFNTESNKDLLIDFLNAIIGLSEENRICEVQFLKPEQLDKMNINRNAVFDAYCKTELGQYSLWRCGTTLPFSSGIKTFSIQPFRFTTRFWQEKSGISSWMPSMPSACFISLSRMDKWTRETICTRCLLRI